MSLNQYSIPNLLADLAQRQPDDTAYTFIDYERDATGGFVERLSWGEVHRRALAVAAALRPVAEVGDRAVILAPQGLDYIVGLYGAMHAGLVAVPLPPPMPGAHDERVLGVMRDCMPAAILTTSEVFDLVLPYAKGVSGGPVAQVIEIDAVQLEDPDRSGSWSGRHYPLAYLQYTSGSTRQPAGVVISHHNVVVNVAMVMTDYFGNFEDEVPPPELTFVSWLPFYHDMGLIQGVLAPLMVPRIHGKPAGRPVVLMSPMAFLQRPARWMQVMAANSRTWSSAPNFALELAVRRTSDEDMAGLDLAGVAGIICGSERIHAATIRRFTERFSTFHLPATTIRPSYGMAEATLYVTSTPPLSLPTTVEFDSEKLSAGYAKRCDSGGGCELISYGPTDPASLRIVDPDTRIENSDGKIGEIWLHGDHVASEYWRNPAQTAATFGAQLVNPAAGTPADGWLRTGDLGVLSEGELFIIGRIKDLLIVDGRNHYPDDIEATIQQITGGRVAAVSVPDDSGERLVTIVEIRSRGDSEDAVRERLHTKKLAIARAVSQTHGVRVADLVLVEPGAIPITTSGKVKRAACGERYRRGEFTRVDA